MFESDLDLFAEYLCSCSEKDATIIEGLIKETSEARKNPRLVLFPISKLYDFLTTILASNSVFNRKFGAKIAALRSVLSMCKIVESIIKSRHPIIMKDPRRSLTLMRSNLLISIHSSSQKVLQRFAEKGRSNQAKEIQSC